MQFTFDQIRAFHYWIQGYPGFYEPIVGECLHIAGYRVLRRPAVVRRADIQRVSDALFDGHRHVGEGLDERAIRRHLAGRRRLQPDLLLERGGRRYLAELKSWGGFNASGQFDLSVARSGFIKDFRNGLFLLVDRLDGVPIVAKILVVSSRSPEHEQVRSLLQNAYQTELELLYLDEMLAMPQAAGFVEQQLCYLDAAVAELKQSVRGTET